MADLSPLVTAAEAFRTRKGKRHDASQPSNFVRFPPIESSPQHGGSTSRAARRGVAGGSQTDRGVYGRDNTHQSLPDIRAIITAGAPAGAPTGAQTGRVRPPPPHRAQQQQQQQPAAATSRQLPPSISSPTLAPITALALDGGVSRQPLSAWALGSSAHQSGVGATTKGKYASDEARAIAWKQAAVEAELAQGTRRRVRGAGEAPQRGGRTARAGASRGGSDGHSRRPSSLPDDFFDEKRHDSDPDADSPPGTPPDADEPYTREVVRYLRAASPTAELSSDTTRSIHARRPSSVSLQALLNDQSRASSTSHARKDSGGHADSFMRQLSRQNSGAPSAPASGRNTPNGPRRGRDIDSRASMRSLPTNKRQNAHTSSAKQSQFRSRLHSPVGGESESDLLPSDLLHAPLGRLETVTDDAGTDKTSAYYAIIQSAARRIQEYVDTLEPDEEYELRAEYRRQGMSEDDIQQKMKRRQQIIQNNLSQSHAHIGGGPTPTTLLFSPFTASSSNSSASGGPGLTPSLYDRYRESFSTAQTLLESMSRNDKNRLFSDVNAFFLEKQQLESSESRHLSSLESENTEKEAAVEASKQSIDDTIKAKEINTIKILNAYYNSLRKSHRKHVSTQRSLANLAASDAASAARGDTARTPIGLSTDIDFMTLDETGEGEEDPLLTSAFGQVDFKTLRLLPTAAPPSEHAFSAPPQRHESFLVNDATNSLLTRTDSAASIKHSTSSRGLHESPSTASVSTSAMDVLQEKLTGYGGEEAHRLKLELLISMLYSKLNEQNSLLQQHAALVPRKRAFEEKAAALLRQIADRQSALAEEATQKKQALEEHRRTEERLQHLAHFDNTEAMMASVARERSMLARAREEKEEAFLAALHADRHDMEEHVKDADRTQIDLASRMKRLDAELAHVQKLRESDRLQNRLAERKMKKEVLLVLHGKVPPALQKELDEEQEAEASEKRAGDITDRSDRGETVGPRDSPVGPIADPSCSEATIDHTERKEAEATSMHASDHSSDSDDDHTEKESDADGGASDSCPAAPSSTAVDPRGSMPSRRASMHVQPALWPADLLRTGNSRPGTTKSARVGSSRARPKPSTPQPPPAPLVLDPNETPAALTTLREGVAALQEHRRLLQSQIDDEVRAMNDLGIPLREQGEDDRLARRRTNTMDALHEDEEHDDDEAAAKTTDEQQVVVIEQKQPQAASPRRNPKSPKKALRRRSLPDAASAKSILKTRPIDASPRITKRTHSRLAAPAQARRAASVPRAEDDSAGGAAAAPQHTKNDGDSAAASTATAKSTKTASKKSKAKSKKQPKVASRKKGTAAPVIAKVDSASTATASDSVVSVPQPTTVTIAAETAAASGARRLSFESRYAALLASPDAIPPTDDNEVILDMDASGKITGAFTRREMHAQTARFKAQIVSLESERVSMMDEITKLEAVHAKLAVSEETADHLQATLAGLNADLADLMSRLRAIYLEANAHGLVIGDDMTADDVAEHAIWLEDGYTGEAHLPGLEMEEEWTADWQVQEDRRIAAAKKEVEEMMHAMKSASEKSRKEEFSVSPVVTPSGSVRPPPIAASAGGASSILSAAQAAALAAEHAEDALDEEDECRMAKDSWEEMFRDQFEESTRTAFTSRTQRFTHKIAKLQAQMESVRAGTTDWEIVKEKIALLQEKLDAASRTQEEDLLAKMAAAEVTWQAQWDAKLPERQARRAEVRHEAAQLEALAVSEETARLKTEKRNAANRANSTTKRGHATATATALARRLQTNTSSATNSGTNSAALSPRASIRRERTSLRRMKSKMSPTSKSESASAMTSEEETDTNETLAGGAEETAAATEDATIAIAVTPILLPADEVDLSSLPSSLSSLHAAQARLLQSKRDLAARIRALKQQMRAGDGIDTTEAAVTAIATAAHSSAPAAGSTGRPFAVAVPAGISSAVAVRELLSLSDDSAPRSWSDQVGLSTDPQLTSIDAAATSSVHLALTDRHLPLMPSTEDSRARRRASMRNAIPLRQSNSYLLRHSHSPPRRTAAAAARPQSPLRESLSEYTESLMNDLLPGAFIQGALTSRDRDARRQQVAAAVAHQTVQQQQMSSLSIMGIGASVGRHRANTTDAAASSLFMRAFGDAYSTYVDSLQPAHTQAIPKLPRLSPAHGAPLQRRTIIARHQHEALAQERRRSQGAPESHATEVVDASGELAQTDASSVLPIHTPLHSLVGATSTPSVSSSARVAAAAGSAPPRVLHTMDFSSMLADEPGLPPAARSHRAHTRDDASAHPTAWTTAAPRASHASTRRRSERKTSRSPDRIGDGLRSDHPTLAQLSANASDLALSDESPPASIFSAAPEPVVASSPAPMAASAKSLRPHPRAAAQPAPRAIVDLSHFLGVGVSNSAGGFATRGRWRAEETRDLADVRDDDDASAPLATGVSPRTGDRPALTAMNPPSSRALAFSLPTASHSFASSLLSSAVAGAVDVASLADSAHVDAHHMLRALLQSHLAAAADRGIGPDSERTQQRRGDTRYTTMSTRVTGHIGVDGGDARSRSVAAAAAATAASPPRSLLHSHSLAALSSSLPPPVAQPADVAATTPLLTASSSHSPDAYVRALLSARSTSHLHLRRRGGRSDRRA